MAEEMTRPDRRGGARQRSGRKSKGSREHGTTVQISRLAISRIEEWAPGRPFNAALNAFLEAWRSLAVEGFVTVTDIRRERDSLSNKEENTDKKWISLTTDNHDFVQSHRLPYEIHLSLTLSRLLKTAPPVPVPTPQQGTPTEKRRRGRPRKKAGETPKTSSNKARKRNIYLSERAEQAVHAYKISTDAFSTGLSRIILEHFPPLTQGHEEVSPLPAEQQPPPRRSRKNPRQRHPVSLSALAELRINERRQGLERVSTCINRLLESLPLPPEVAQPQKR